ncbi:fatty acid desaturase family protein [Pseudomonadota bacterium]
MADPISSPQVNMHSVRHNLLKRYFKINPSVYYFDFGASIIVGWVAFGFAVVKSNHLLIWGLATIVATFAIYRAVMFTHELAHFHNNKMRTFNWIWNAACGIPLLVPSFFYHGVHNEHHFRGTFSTSGDGEYLPFGRPPRFTMYSYLASNFFLPSLLIIRFTILGPLSWLSPHARDWVWRRVSSLSIDFSYQRSVPTPTPKLWLVQETLCSIYIWILVLLVVYGILPAMIIIEWHIVGISILLLNAFRTLVAHRYTNAGGTTTFDEQIADSINITGGSILTPLLAPVGLRYHGLHHVFPVIPYHNLGAAHRNLMKNLPDDAAYQQTLFRTFLHAFRLLWRNSGGKLPSSEATLP